MIHIGLDDDMKRDVVDTYKSKHGIDRVHVLSPARFAPSFAAEHMTDPTTQSDGRTPGLFVDWPNLIEYRYYYRLLDQIRPDTLVIVNECLRTTKRHDLTYNCIRAYLARTPHAIVFQYLPILETIEDFMILFDFATHSRWRRESFGPSVPLHESQIHVHHTPIELRAVHVPVTDKTRKTYARDKAKLLAEVRADPDKDPHLIPRNLLLVSGKDKLAHVHPGQAYVGRNNRFKLGNVATYKDVAGRDPRIVFEPPHGHLDFADFLAVTRQSRIDVLVADTKADHWYFDRFAQWAKKVNDAAAALHG